MAEAQAMVGEEILKLCVDIRRIAEGGDEISYGQFVDDHLVEQTYEAPFGTLKAARKAGLVAFEGELLLKGKDDAVPIRLVGPGLEAAGGAAPAPTAASAKAKAEAETPAAPAQAAAAADAAPAAADKAGPAGEELAPAASAEEPGRTATDEQAAAAAAETEAAAPAAAPAAAAEGANATGDQGAPSPADGKRWSVDTSYIDWRTKDPNRLEARRSEVDGAVVKPGAVTLEGVESALGTAQTKKDEEGKWKVDTKYIDHRTSDPNRLEIRRSSSLVDPADSGAAAAAKPTLKDDAGKWQPVDTSYINHRTADCENLDGRRTSGRLSVGGGASAAGGAASINTAMVKRESDGKWKVDTSYVNYRTADTGNLTRNLEKDAADPVYANPTQKSYTLEELVKPPDERPKDVDPANRELYLSDADFQEVFQMTKSDFEKLAKWKKQNMKKAKDLF